ncbi:palmitoleoyl-protein carboxylesterase NOTUM-like protein [Leptotrombidium deliense]|uniref:Palmitoleoyl-protein carboxylesterase NOTUM-like protein n=1 Tax=Leptotrombidium deliense TaxID=299467 RepID=A0A443SMQ5_9ACAR|nr:palmitoleoyl-protein carboxylesterase NOTUM-like protein [Leptotrombidium deliense]
MALLLLLIMGIVISSTSGRHDSSSEIDTETADSLLEDATLSETRALPKSALLDSSSKQSPQISHISNQHTVLRKLSQAFDSGGKKKNRLPADDDYGGSQQMQDNEPHHLNSHHSGQNRVHGNDLRRVMLRNTSVTCNDGTTAGYYIRESHGSRRWIVFLEGGWYCFSTNTCHQRWLRMRNLMSSAHWPEVRTVGGILSPEADENPFWWNANHVFVPYCSSDTWSGDSMAKSPREFSFLGARIIEHVILELLPRGLYDAHSLLIAGSSAGAGGVLVNLDRVADLLVAMGSKVEVRGLSDSGWFLDNEPFDFHTALGKSSSTFAVPSKRAAKPCIDTYNCSPVETVKQGIKLWNGQVPSACKSRHEAEPWKCYFGYRIYETLRTPLFVVQWLFDEAQMTADNVGTPISKAQWNYIHRMGQELRKTLENVTYVSIRPAIAVQIIKDWTRIKINGFSLPQTLRCWELQGSERNHHDFDLMFSANVRMRITANVGRDTSSNDSDLLADSPVHPLHRFSQSMPSEHTNIPLVEKIRRKKRKRKNRRRHPRLKRSKERKHGHDRHRWLLHEDLCDHHLIDSCSWPQCNRGCPRLHNPFTGEEVDFKELLRSFGFDMSSVANAFGVDEKSLHEMDQETLFQLLTQR